MRIISGASHFDLYKKPQYVKRALDKMAKFFGKNLWAMNSKESLT